MNAVARPAVTHTGGAAARGSLALALVLALLLAACGTAPPAGRTAPPAGTGVATPPATPPVSGSVRQQARSRWVPVPWTELPGWDNDALAEAWPAWVRSCERPSPDWAAACAQVRRLAGADVAQQRAWMQAALQPHRVEDAQGASQGLLTAYYEPVLDASRQRRAGFEVPLYRPPAGLRARKPWYTREEMDTLPEARAALAGAELLWVGDAVDALVLQIQGSGRLRVTEADGRQRLVRLAFAATNDQPYRSVGRWLLDQGLVREASWPTIRAWLTQNPQRVQELLWSNPRVVFFREEALPESDAPGPRGAQGVPLTAGRSIAVDPQSIPYGAPVWLDSPGPTRALRRLVLAQDTGSAIVGAVRADYFVGAGQAAGEEAGRLKQALRLWVLWPRP